MIDRMIPEISLVFNRKNPIISAMSVLLFCSPRNISEIFALYSKYPSAVKARRVFVNCSSGESSEKKSAAPRIMKSVRNISSGPILNSSDDSSKGVCLFFVSLSGYGVK